MGFTVQMQRRAIERLRVGASRPPKDIGDHRLFLTTGKRIYIWGISDGVGTCADVKDMDVIVVAKSNPGKNWERMYHKNSLPTSRYVVLSRPPTKEEEKKAHHLYGDNVELNTVELLRFVSRDKRGLHFKVVGKTSTYVEMA
ncbi:MAG: hypothetical protein WC508_04170 [Patescibacteria group bacterium]